jgi:hypothetical protein
LTHDPKKRIDTQNLAQSLAYCKLRKLLNSTSELQKEQSTLRGRFRRGFNRVLQAVNNHAVVGDVLIQSQGGAAGFVWGSIRLLLRVNWSYAAPGSRLLNRVLQRSFVPRSSAVKNAVKLLSSFRTRSSAGRNNYNSSLPIKPSSPRFQTFSLTSWNILYERLCSSPIPTRPGPRGPPFVGQNSGQLLHQSSGVQAHSIASLAQLLKPVSHSWLTRDWMP